jgi:hypothetical protein
MWHPNKLTGIPSFQSLLGGLRLNTPPRRASIAKNPFPTEHA